ncbi:hypothetical protein M3P05_17915 [Sansalvadorimonas sp. 2012CJ34-2]|uniref:Uncharacterized protein n=1 Tax=Parendozoicomonas callyspongiae TaxID=2942213 RepID=A0ABT0PKB4_9GAMM|nr:hypothetical protein [Sansalvadorimonas sp. 2012CJ34-2]MCL6271799.1 hypothetical protein [Sansalvadorimonas sp. 2012CJ34-2]
MAYGAFLRNISGDILYFDKSHHQADSWELLDDVNANIGPLNTQVNATGDPGYWLYHFYLSSAATRTVARLYHNIAAQYRLRQKPDQEPAESYPAQRGSRAIDRPALCLARLPAGASVSVSAIQL